MANPKVALQGVSKRAFFVVVCAADRQFVQGLSTVQQFRQASPVIYVTGGLHESKLSSTTKPMLPGNILLPV